MNWITILIGVQNFTTKPEDNKGFAIEYDIDEHFTGKNDKYYATMSRILLETGMVTDIHDVYTMSNEKKGLCYKLLRQKTRAYGKQIASFLHYQIEE